MFHLLRQFFMVQKLRKQSNNSVSSVVDKYCSLLYSNGVALFVPSAFDPWSQYEKGKQHKGKQHIRIPLGGLPLYPEWMLGYLAFLSFLIILGPV